MFKLLATKIICLIKGHNIEESNSKLDFDFNHGGYQKSKAYYCKRCNDYIPSNELIKHFKNKSNKL